MNNFNLINLLEPEHIYDANTKKYVDNTIPLAKRKTKSEFIARNVIDMNNLKLKQLAEPVNDNDVVTKKYVDDVVTKKYVDDAVPFSKKPNEIIIYCARCY